MDEAEIEYFQSNFYDDYLGEEEELMNDVIVKSGLLEFDSESEDDLFTVESPPPKKQPTLCTATESPKEVTLKQEVLSEEEENEPGTSEETIIHKSVPQSTNVIKFEDRNGDFDVEVITTSTVPINPKLVQNTIKTEPLLDIKVENIDVPEEMVKKLRRQSYEKCQVKEETIDLGAAVVKQEPPDIDDQSKSDVTISTSNGLLEEGSASTTETSTMSIYPASNYEMSIDQMYQVPSMDNEVDTSYDNAISSSSLSDDRMFGSSSNNPKPTDGSSNENALPNLSDNSFFSSKILRRRLEQPQKETPVETLSIESIDALSRAFHPPEGAYGERVFSDFHFKVESVNIEGLKTNFICIKCDETVQDYTSVLAHPCFDSTNALPSLECFYCRRFIISNVEFIQTHFSGVLNFFLLNNHISVYKCCYKNCVFITPSSTCFSLHLKLTHCQNNQEKKETKKSESKKPDFKKLEVKRKPLPPQTPSQQIDFGNDLYSCEHCQNKFPNESSLRRHEAKHEISRRKDYNFVCNYCNFRAVFMSSLKVHLNFAHNKCINYTTPTAINKYLITKK